MYNNKEKIDCDYSYDEELKSKIDFYKIHPEYMPFVGKDYERFRILLVGESHYVSWINYSDQAINYSGSFKKDSFNNVGDGESFNYWYDIGIPEKLKNTPDPDSAYDNLTGWFTTRKVVDRWCLDAERAENTKQIFSYTIKPMRDLLNKKESRDDTPSNEIYNYYAFMNYFQRPSRKPGGKSEFSDEKNVAGEDKTVAKEVLTKVIEILDPNVVFFISAKAYEYFNIRDKKYIRLVHPTCSWWNRSSKYCKNNFDGRTPNQEFGYVLEKIYDGRKKLM